MGWLLGILSWLVSSLHHVCRSVLSCFICMSRSCVLLLHFSQGRNNLRKVLETKKTSRKILVEGRLCACASALKNLDGI